MSTTRPERGARLLVLGIVFGVPVAEAFFSYDLCSV
jgi:hypothetical protein